jgi:hypothetical protein
MQLRIYIYGPDSWQRPRVFLLPNRPVSNGHGRRSGGCKGGHSVELAFQLQVLSPQPVCLEFLVSSPSQFERRAGRDARSHRCHVSSLSIHKHRSNWQSARRVTNRCGGFCSYIHESPSYYVTLGEGNACLTKNHAMKTYGEVELRLHAIHGNEWSASRPGCFTLWVKEPDADWIGGPRAGVVAVVKMGNHFPCRESNPGNPTWSLVAILIKLFRITVVSTEEIIQSGNILITLRTRVSGAGWGDCNLTSRRFVTMKNLQFSRLVATIAIDLGFDSGHSRHCGL